MRLLGKPSPTSGVRWPVDGDVEVEVRPLSGQNLFSRDKTYLLVGLTGGLGQSLAEWMASNGAGHIILASRRPDVDERLLASFRGSGTTVKVMAIDVLDKERLRAAVRDIRTTCPPMGGVANSAMVLQDSLFFNMSAEWMRIAQASGKQEALAVLQEAFSSRLRATLQMDGNAEAFDENTPLVQLGMDSLMAVEARSWFLKELKGGASLAELCRTALEKLNADG
ncbi:beta-ketoacyl synthase domain-containing protein [Colletotrichum musicola]|uniref:Beta-ketoacyl synthase domain-containing protein n=1 Tax=Colletotrichum musicola TaxID=2175873 RepID=A0A8H6KMZ9_9PEZI|nr:beta-ketoacyl synthase domain-containing protein [Colletotrichum musicola]